MFSLDLLSAIAVFADLDSNFGFAWHSRMNFFSSLGGVGGVDLSDTDESDDATLRSLAVGVGVSSHLRTTSLGGCRTYMVYINNIYLFLKDYLTKTNFAIFSYLV